jgi:hypothetical protein
LQIPLKEGIGDERRPKERVKTRVIFRRTVIALIALHLNHQKNLYIIMAFQIMEFSRCPK